MRRPAVLTLRREDGRIVCESVTLVDTIFRRMRGLLGRRTLPPGEGMLLRPAWSIHTAFMRFPIDVVFLDSDLVVLKIDHALRPFRTSSFRGAREVVELSAGECARRGLEVGDRITWAPAIDEDLLPDVKQPSSDRRGSVVVASRDPRFTRLARVLLDGRGIDVAATVSTDRVFEELAALERDGGVVLLDADDNLADGLRVAGTITAAHPDVTLVVAAEQAGERAAGPITVYDKWNDTEALLEAVVEAVDTARGPAVEAAL